MKVIGIIQVRMGSSRLPNKALEDLSGIPAIVRMIKRVINQDGTAKIQTYRVANGRIVNNRLP